MRTKVLHVLENSESKSEGQPGPARANVVSLKEFKLKKEKFKELASYTKYLAVLHPVDLLNEVRFLTEELKATGSDLIFHKTKILIKELSQRVSETSPKMAVVMQKLIHNLEANMDQVVG